MTVEHYGSRPTSYGVTGDELGASAANRLLDALEAWRRRNDWMDEAACKGRGDLFFPMVVPEGVRPDRHEALRRSILAKEICATCPVFAQCAETRTPDDVGIWAGVNYDRPGIGRTNRPTEEAKAEALRLYRETEMGTHAISAQTGVSRETINKMARDAGIPPRAQQLRTPPEVEAKVFDRFHHDHMKFKQIAREFNINEKTIAKIVRRVAKTRGETIGNQRNQPSAR